MSSRFPRPSFYREGDPSRMMNRPKIQSFFEDGKVLRSRTNCVKMKERNASKNKHNMSTETQYFIQKICYRKTASIDMTRYGFINDSKVDPVNYVMKSLRTQLEKICVKPVVAKSSFSPVLPRTKLRDAITSTERRLPPYIPKPVKPVVVKRIISPVLPQTKPREAVTSSEQIPLCIPKSALSCPGTRSSRTRCRVRIQSEPNPGPEPGQKKELVSPNKNKERTPCRKK